MEIDIPCKRRRRLRIDSEPSTTTINKLVDDLLVEILIRSFPNPKPAFRSKLVCKRWRNLISDPILFNRRFVSHHKTINEATLSSSPPPPLLLTPSPSSSSTLFRHNHCLSFLPVPDDLGPDFTVLDSFHDLLLCDFSGSSYFLCNPFTKQWVLLPSPPYRGCWRTEERVAMLAVEPVNPTRLDLGVGQAAMVYDSHYRFRVVLMYGDQATSMGCRRELDVFCSESGRWTECDEGYLKTPMFERVITTSDGRLFGTHRGSQLGPDDDDDDDDGGGGGLNSQVLVVVNPFRLDVRPTYVFDSIAFPRRARCFISVSQGALHKVVFDFKEEDEILEHTTKMGSSRTIIINGSISVWRVKEDDHEGGYYNSWRKLHDVKVLLKKMLTLSSTTLGFDIDDYELDKRCLRVDLHPQKPEIVFLSYLVVAVDGKSLRDKKVVVLSYDLTAESTTTREPELVGVYPSDWRAFQPCVPGWPTAIPNYEKLRAASYDDCYDHLLRWQMENSGI